MIKRFWNYRDFKKMNQKIEQLYRTFEHMQAVAIVVCTAGLFGFYLRPLIKANRGLIMESFVPDSYAVGALILISQFHCVSMAVPVVLAYDFVYFALCIHIGFQLKLLKERIKDTLRRYKEDVRLEINSCIRHHQFLLTLVLIKIIICHFTQQFNFRLSMFFRMQKIYSVTLLFHYFGSFVTTCSVLFEIMLR